MTDPVLRALERAVALVEQARSLPMSASAVVDRTALLALLEQVRAVLPPELERARLVLRERDALLAEGRREAAALVEQARAEADRLVSASEVHARAAEEAARLVEEAREAARTMQVEADDYVDGRLATLEIALHSTLRSVERGRAKLAGRSSLDELTGLGRPDDPGLR